MGSYAQPRAEWSDDKREEDRVEMNVKNSIIPERRIRHLIPAFKS